MLRKELQLSQTEFAKRIGISQTNLSWLERSGNRVVERNIKQISLIFNVHEQWLRDGTGEKFKRNTMSEFFNDPTLDEIDRKILMSYVNMNPTQRQYIKNWINSIVKMEQTATQPESLQSENSADQS